MGLKVELHRTKCTAIIKNVIAPDLLSELIDDVSDMPYSLIIDESTDVSTIKYMCICIKYFSSKNNCVTIDFLSLLEVEKADANTLYSKLSDYLEEIGLKKNK